MDKLETFLKQLSKKYNCRTSDNSNDYYKLLGTGCFSVVFDVDGAAYKITTELDYDKQVELANKINDLYIKGVNVPYTYCIHSYNDNRLFLDSVRISAEKNSYKDFVAGINNLIAEWKDKDHSRHKKFCGIYQEKIDGDIPFSKNAYYANEATLFAKKDVESVILGNDSSNLKLAIEVRKIQKDINDSLDYFLNIPNEHYVKFIKDAFTIHYDQIHIDNVTRKNFIYNKEKGFYFLDLGALNYQDIELIDRLYWPVTCTITNVLTRVYYPPHYFNEASKIKYLQLFTKLYDCLGECYLQNINNESITKDINRYVCKMRRASDFYRMYKLFANQVPAEISKELFDQVKYVESLVSGKALKSGEEYENY